MSCQWKFEKLWEKYSMHHWEKNSVGVTGILSPKVNYLNVYHNHSDN